MGELERQKRRWSAKQSLLSIQMCLGIIDDLDPKKESEKRADLRANGGPEEEKFLTWTNCKRDEWAVLGKNLGLFALCDWSLASVTPEQSCPARHCQLEITPGIPSQSLILS